MKFDIDLTDFISSLKFHAKSLQDGGIYINLEKTTWYFASIQSTHSDLWCLEKIGISQNLSDDLFKPSPLQFFFDKPTVESFLSFIGIIKKNKSLFNITVTEKSYIFDSNGSTYELAREDISFPGFSEDLDKFVSIKTSDWAAIKFFASKIDPAAYLKAVSGVYVDKDSYIYATDMSNVFIGKVKGSYDKAFFVPSGVISKDLTPSKDVSILAGPKCIVFQVDNIKFIINHPIEGNQVTNNDVFPVGEARTLRDGFPSDWKAIGTIEREGLQTISDSFSQYIAQQKTDEIGKYNFAMVLHEDKIIVNAVGRNYKSNIQVPMASIDYTQDKPKQLVMTKKFSNAINPFLPVLKGSDNGLCTVMYSQTNDIIAIYTQTGLHPINDMLVLTNHVTIQR